MKNFGKQNTDNATPIVGDLFAGNKIYQPVKIKSKFIINNFLSPKDFKGNKLSKKYIKKNFTFVKSNNHYKKALVSRQEYYKLHPKKYYAKLAFKGLKRTIATFAILAIGYFGAKYGPCAINFASKWYEAKHLPKTVIMAEFNPESIEYDETVILPKETKAQEIKLDSDSVESFKLLTSELENLNSSYSGIDASVSPKILNFDEENNLINLYCDCENNQIVKFAFDVYNENIFNSIFNADTVLQTDVINGLRILLSDENISDLPQFYNSVNKNIIASDVKNEIQGKIIDGEYIENDVFAFSTTELIDDKIFDKEIQIDQSIAENLPNFDANNINSLLKIYAKDASMFQTKVIKEYNNNIANVIFNSMTKRKEQEQILE